MTQKIEFDITDVLTETQMTAIAEEEFRAALRRKLMDASRRNEIDIMMSNIAYDIVIEEVAKVWDGDLTEYLRDKVAEIIKSNSLRFELFADVSWGQCKGPAKIALEEMMDELKPVIREEAEKRIREYPFHELERDEISDVIMEVIEKRLFGKRLFGKGEEDD